MIDNVECKNGRDYQQDWDNHWKEIICDAEGNINIEQLKKELSDFSICLEEVPKVYCAFTRDTLSYVTYPADTVITLAQDIQNEEYEERKKEDNESLISEIATVIKDSDADCREYLYDVLASLSGINVERLTMKNLNKLEVGNFNL